MSTNEQVDGTRIFALRVDIGTIQPAQVSVTDEQIVVELSGLRVDFPRRRTTARRMPDDPAPGGPAHLPGRETAWRWTTATQGIVQLEVDVPVTGVISAGVAGRSIAVTSLLVSVREADALVTLLQQSPEDR